MYNPNIKMLIQVAKGLEDLIENVVFVGGTVVPFYFEDEAIRPVRVTDDIDFVIELESRLSFYEFESRLEKLGFKHSMDKDAPICRWEYDGVSVDAMPVDSKILGFSNRWYKEGLKNLNNVNLEAGLKISIFSLPYFIASKIDAYYGRGDSDFRLSRDIEDIISILDAQINFDRFNNISGNVKKYLIDNFKKFLSNNLFIESISCHIEDLSGSTIRSKRILDFLNEFVK